MEFFFYFASISWNILNRPANALFTVIITLWKAFWRARASRSHEKSLSKNRKIWRLVVRWRNSATSSQLTSQLKAKFVACNHGGWQLPNPDRFLTLLKRLALMWGVPWGLFLYFAKVNRQKKQRLVLDTQSRFLRLFSLGKLIVTNWFDSPDRNLEWIYSENIWPTYWTTQVHS